MIGDALIVGLLYSFLAGGSIKALSQVEIRRLWLVVAAAVVQYGGQWLSNQGAHWIATLGQPIYLVSLVAVLVFAWSNRHLPGFWLAGLGVLCNTVVIAANEGHMPVSPQALQTINLDHALGPLRSGAIFTHTAMEQGTYLKWLGDIIALPHPYPRPKVASIGDFILAAGVIACISGIMRPWPYRQKSVAVPRE